MLATMFHKIWDFEKKKKRYKKNAKTFFFEEDQIIF